MPEPGGKFEAFVDALFTEHRDWLVLLASRMTRDVDPQDLVHDVFIRARKHARTVFEHHNPVAWVVKALKNLIIDQGRRAACFEANEPAIVPVLYPEKTEVPRWQQVPPQIVDQAVRRLVGEDKTIARMRLNGCTFKEISKTIGCPIPTLHRRFQAMLPRLEAIVRDNYLM